MEATAAPPPFLPVAGTPSIPWKQWLKIFQNFLLAIGGENYSVSRKAAWLQTCLGPEGQRIYQSMPPEAKKEGEPFGRAR